MKKITINDNEVGKEYLEQLEKIVQIRKERRKKYKDSFLDDDIDTLLTIIKHKLETESKFHSSHECFDENGICGTVHCQEGETTKIKVLQNMKIRKLTPKECFRLQGFLEDEINIEGISDSQCYKMAGNGWCLCPVKQIFKQMFKTQLNLSGGNK